MNYTAEILLESEIENVEKLLNRLKIPHLYFVEYIIDYEKIYDDNLVNKKIILFLNKLTRIIDDERDSGNFIRTKIIIDLRRPITNKKYIKFVIVCAEEEKYFVTFDGQEIETDNETFNCTIGYLVSKGMVYDYDVKSVAY